MHLNDLNLEPTGTIDGPTLTDPAMRPVPAPVLDVERPVGARLRYVPGTQTSLTKRVRPRERRAVILSLEGVLVDTREASTLSWLVALHDGGHDVSIDLLRHLSGVAAGELLRIVAGLSADSADGREIVRQQERIFRNWYLPRILPYSGARRLLQRMKADGLRLIVLSSGTWEMAPLLVRASGVADLLDDVVTTDGEPRDAALDEIVTSVIARCECSREGVVVLGDSPYDVATGERGGIDVVALRSGGWTDATLQGAVAVYEDHIHLLTQYANSPFAGVGSAIPHLRLARVQ
jgi:phosphoglycolate phosphatase-like HAD superfamily hydrolase